MSLEKELSESIALHVMNFHQCGRIIVNEG